MHVQEGIVNPFPPLRRRGDLDTLSAQFQVLNTLDFALAKGKLFQSGVKSAAKRTFCRRSAVIQGIFKIF